MPASFQNICVGEHRVDDVLAAPTDNGCKIVKLGEGRPFMHSKVWSCIAIPNFEGVWLPMAHGACEHNELTGAAGRVLGETPEITILGELRLWEIARRFSKFMHKCIPEEWYETPGRYSGAKRLKYEQATDEYLAGCSKLSDSHLTGMVKWEKNRPKPSKPNPDPRMVHFPNPRYMIQLARLLRPIEIMIYIMRGDGKLFPSSKPIIKGLNSWDQAQAIYGKWLKFEDPVCLGIDCSRYDKHIKVEHLRMERYLYSCANSDPELYRLITAQFKSVAKTRNGLKYKIKGKRASGHYNTGVGNSILMLLFIVSSLHRSEIRYELGVNGDDAFVITNRGDMNRVKELLSFWFIKFGMTLAVESEATCFEQIEFCQSRPVCIGGRWRLIRDPFKVMSCATSNAKYHEDNYKLRTKLLAAVGQAELALCDGVPVLQEYALALIRNSHGAIPLEFNEADNIWHRVRREVGVDLASVQARPIDDDTRDSFNRAFGISPSQQASMERYLRNWDFELVGDSFHIARFGNPGWVEMYPTECATCISA